MLHRCLFELTGLPVAFYTHQTPLAPHRQGRKGGIKRTYPLSQTGFTVRHTAVQTSAADAEAGADAGAAPSLLDVGRADVMESERREMRAIRRETGLGSIFFCCC